MNKVIGILLIGILTACNSIVITKSEEKALGNVNEFYEGKCSWTKGITSVNGKTEKYIELTYSDSDIIKKFGDHQEFPASTIAYLFYSNLNKKENELTQINVKINQSSGKSYLYSYSIKELERAEQMSPIFLRTCELIKNHNYSHLLAKFDSSDTTVSIEKLKNFCIEVDSLYGKIEFTQFQGFSHREGTQDKRHYMQFLGFMKREKETHPVTVYIDMRTYKIRKLNYDFE